MDDLLLSIFINLRIYCFAEFNFLNTNNEFNLQSIWKGSLVVNLNVFLNVFYSGCIANYVGLLP